MSVQMFILFFYIYTTISLLSHNMFNTLHLTKRVISTYMKAHSNMKVKDIISDLVELYPTYSRSLIRKTVKYIITRMKFVNVEEKDKKSINYDKVPPTFKFIIPASISDDPFKDTRVYARIVQSTALPKSTKPDYYAEEKLLSEDQCREWVINTYTRYLPTDRSEYYESYEVYDMDKVDYLIGNAPSLQKKYPQILRNRMVNMLRKIRLLSVNGVIRTYCRSTKSYNKDGLFFRCGRKTQYKQIGYQSMKREIRSFLMDGVYCEIDVANCHPVVLSTFCDLNNINCEYITKYCENRDIFLNDLMKTTEKSREFAKEVYLEVLNGGLKSYKALQIKPQSLTNMVENIKSIREGLCLIYNKMLKGIQKNYKNEYQKKMLQYQEGNLRKKPEYQGSVWHSKVSLVSHLMQQKESEILDKILNYLQERKKLNQVHTLIFDGIAIPIDKFDVEKMAEYVYKQANIKVSLKIKKYKSDITFGYKNTNNLDIKQIKPKIKKMRKNCIFENKFKKLKKYLPTCIATDGKITKDDIEWDQEVRVERLPNFMSNLKTYKTIHVKAIMGSGKTYRLFEYIKTRANLSVLIISFRRTLCNEYKLTSNKLGLGFNVYNEPGLSDGVIKSSKYNRLIVQVNSLHRIRGAFDLIVLDEITYTLDMVVAHCERRNQVYNNLLSYIQMSKYVVTMDAYLSKSDINFVDNLRKHKSFKFKGNHLKRKKDVVYNVSEMVLIQKIANILSEGGKAVLATNTKTFADKLAALFDRSWVCEKTDKRGVEELHNIVNPVHVKVLLLTSETPIVPGCEWGKYDLVIYTPTITAGISYNKLNVFTARFGLFVSNSSNSYINTQMMFRVRHCIDPSIYMCIKQNNKALRPISDDNIHDYLTLYISRHFHNKKKQKSDQEYNSDSEDDPGLIEDVIEDGDFECPNLRSSKRNPNDLLTFDCITEKYDKTMPFYNLVVNTIKKSNLSYNNIIEEMSNRLAQQGYTMKECQVLSKEAISLDIKTDAIGQIRKIYTDEKARTDVELYKSLQYPLDRYGENEIDGDELDKYIYSVVSKHRLDRSSLENMLRDRYNIEKNIHKKLVDVPDDYLLYVLKNFKNHKFDMSTIGTPDSELLEFTKNRINANTEIIAEEVHTQKRRDYWINIDIGLNVINLLTKESFRNKSNKIDISKKNEIFEYLETRWADLKIIRKYDKDISFDIWRKKHTLKQCFTKLLNTLIKRTGRRLYKKRCRNKSFVGTKYSIVRIIQEWC